MHVLWSAKGGVGVTTVAAGLACAVAARSPVDAVLLVDLGGDVPCAFGHPEVDGPGLGEWMRSSAEVPAAALHRLEIDVAPGVRVLPRGTGPLVADRLGELIAALAREERTVVVDVGSIGSCPVRLGLVDAADRSLLVTRACPLARRRLDPPPAEPTAVVVVRDRGRVLRWTTLAEAAGAPVLAELDVDPAVGRALDVGIARRPLPRPFLAAVGSLL